MPNKKEKTGISEAAVAAFVTSGIIGIMPFLDIEVPILQATNLGIFSSAAICFVLRQLVKCSNNEADSISCMKEQIKTNAIKVTEIDRKLNDDL